jgi:putative DNA primase/helicase
MQLCATVNALAPLWLTGHPWSEAAMSDPIAIPAELALFDHGRTRRATPAERQDFQHITRPVAGTGWPEPEHLSEPLDPLPYPVDDLPLLLRNAVVEVQEFVQAPMALVACSALSTLSIAAQGLANVRRDRHLSGPVSIYVLVVADSGERKTTCDQFFGSVLRDWESLQREQVMPLVTESEAKHAAFEARKAGLADAIKQASKKGEDIVAVEKDLCELMQNAPPSVCVPRLLFVDVTPEQLAYAVGTSWPSAGVLSAEAGSVFGAHSMGQETVLRCQAPA